MSRQKSEWTLWKQYARKLHTKGGWSAFIHEIKDAYPVSVQRTIVAAITVAEVMLKKISETGLCRFYASLCDDCPGGINGVCSFPDSNKAGIYNSIQVYSRLYKEMPDKWKKILS